MTIGSLPESFRKNLEKALNITWQEYCTTLIPMGQRFGKNCFSKNQIDDGFNNYWKDRPQVELLNEVSEAIASGVKFVLNKPKKAKLRPERVIWRDEAKYITDGHLDRWLALNGCKSLSEMLEKEISRNRKKAN